jgi:hypothetical protein
MSLLGYLGIRHVSVDPWAKIFRLVVLLEFTVKQYSHRFESL